MTPLDFRALWDAALPYERYVAESTEHRALWEGVYRLARIPSWALDAVPPDASVRLLVLAEDWCGDASNTVPIVARLAEQSPGLELRVLRRDQHPEVMDRYLTNGSRSIPIIVALDREFRELGYWGPRPSELQSFVLANKGTIPKAELYPQVRRWYARDRGETTLRDVLAIISDTGRPAA